MTQATAVTSETTPNERLEELLQAAAVRFEKRGYAATAIDTVARFMGATNGRVYHYFPSKLDLFSAVRERGMETVFEATDPGYHADLPAVDRLTLMALGHVRAMLLHHSFMQVHHKEGLRMHRYGAITPEQREATQRHIERRDAYEGRFREVVREGAEQGKLKVGEPFGITVQAFLSALHGPVTWIYPRPDDAPGKLETLALEVVRFAMQGLGHDLTARDWARLTKDERPT